MRGVPCIRGLRVPVATVVGMVDASLSPSVVGSLADAGHDAVHVGEMLPLSASDDLVFDTAVEQKRVIVTADTDFGEILARRQETRPRVRPLPLGGSEAG